jgi:hypothetical protein
MIGFVQAYKPMAETSSLAHTARAASAGAAIAGAASAGAAIAGAASTGAASTGAASAGAASAGPASKQNPTQLKAAYHQIPATRRRPVTVGRAARSAIDAGEGEGAAVSDDTITKDCKLAVSASMLVAGSTIS